MRKIKVGIDVGGTFTHAVAVDVESFSVIGKASVPTTHDSKQGVAEGVIGSMFKLLEDAAIEPGEIILIAHSTTQATNALLEGDVAPVGIIAFGQGVEGYIAKKQANLDSITLAADKTLPVQFKYLNTAEEITDQKLQTAIEDLSSKGAEVFVATQAFGPDDATLEKQAVALAEKMGYMATSACDLSQLYGIKIRTRTAIVNASMMPKMIETANLTEQAVRESGIKAPLMVMRSDGGIMDIAEMRKRPILTMLSGPAAGVAAALMYARISDGIFVEVGGTSSDISVIKNGKPQIKTAQIGDNRLSVKTIDVRTIGVAGGSVPRFDKNGIKDVGPRSAHIANLAYSAYAEKDDFSDISLESIQPKAGDPDDYLKINRDDEAFTITPSAASYYLDLVRDTGHGEANRSAVNNAIEAVAGKLNIKPEALADSILEHCSKKVEEVIKTLVREYKLDRDFIRMYGGGGGASAIVPHAADYLNLKHEIAQNSEVISAIGAAMGMIKDTVEKSVFNPTDEDIIKVRKQAAESVISMGAKPETVEVQIQIDKSSKKVIAVATGSSDMASRDQSKELNEEELNDIVGDALKQPAGEIEKFGETSLLSVRGFEKTAHHFFGLMTEHLQPAVIITNEGTIKRKFDDLTIRNSTVGAAKTVVGEVVEELRSYGDGGELIPEIFVVVSGKIVDMSGLVDLSQMLSFLDMDLKDLPSDDQAIVLGVKKR